jgi:tetratricopeptide (TPR) repeat protein
MSKQRTSIDPRFVILVCTGLIMLALRPTATHQWARQQAHSGFQALESDQAAPALTAFEAAILAEPGLGALHVTTARLALLTDDLERARYHLDQAEAQGITHPDLICLGYVVDILDSSLEETESPIRPDEDCNSLIPILIDRTRQLMDASQWLAAHNLLEQALGWQPEDAQIVAELGLLQSISNPEQAIETLERANQLSGGSDALSLGLIRAIEDSRPSADRAFTLAQVGQALSRFGLWQEASWAFQRSLLLHPGYVEARAYLGLALDQIGQNGYEHLAEAESAYPNAALPHLFLGMHWSARGELSQAQLELEIAVGLDPENPSAWAELGSVYAQQGLVVEAKSAFIQAATLAPSEWEFWFLLAQFSLNLEIEIADLGIPAARNLISLDPDDPRSYDLLGYAHFLNGNIQLAERLLLESISLQPSLASAQYHLGQLRRWQGELAQSQAAFELALQLDPNGPIGELARRALGLPLTQ